jgi:predicted RNA-binding Zn-ribbon protein involved in translation (DUF1610 family)
MTDVLVAVIAVAAALGMYYLGYQAARRYDTARREAFRRADRYRLAWLSARRRAQHHERYATARVEWREAALVRVEAQRDRYRAAWKSARRRAHRGRLLAQLLRESGPMYRCPRCGQAAYWTDGTDTAAGDERDEYWCQTCGEETPLVDCEVVNP